MLLSSADDLLYSCTVCIKMFLLLQTINRATVSAHNQRDAILCPVLHLILCSPFARVCTRLSINLQKKKIKRFFKIDDTKLKCKSQIRCRMQLVAVQLISGKKFTQVFQRSKNITSPLHKVALFYYKKSKIYFYDHCC